MMYNNPATSGIDMTPELPNRMSETIDNVAMAKRVHRCSLIDKLSGGRLLFYNGSNPLVLDAPRSGAAARPGRVCARSRASTCTMRTRRRVAKSRNHLHRAHPTAGVQHGRRTGHHRRGIRGDGCYRPRLSLFRPRLLN